MDDINRQLKKGVLDIVILKLLENKEMYGYELMTRLESDGKGFFAMREGTLYPILYRLEDAGYIRSEWEREQSKRAVPRKYYFITNEGHGHLKAVKTELIKFIDIVKQILEVGEYE